MTLTSSIIIGALLIIGLLNGFRRGSIKEGLALIGILLGALLIEYWANRWSQWISEQTGMRGNAAGLLAALVLLLGTAFFSGYGSGLLLRRTPLKGSDRIGGAVLGLFNTALLISFALRIIQQLYFNETDPTQPVASWVRNNPVSLAMVNWLGYVLLGAAVGLGIFAFAIGTIRLGRRLTRPAPPKKQPAAAGAQPQKQGQPAVAAASGAAPKPAQPASAGASAQQTPKPADGAAGGASAAGVGGAQASQPAKMPVGQRESYLDQQHPRSGP